MPAQLHVLRPTADLAERALLCGDPARCLQLATHLTDRPLMFNHARGLWGYTGTAADGEPLTIQATGLGAASAAVVCDELFRLGVRRAVRVGTARALAGPSALGAAVAVAGAVPLDGPSQALGAAGWVAADAAMTDGLRDAGAEPGAVASTDLPDPADLGAPALAAAPTAPVATDLQTAAVLQTAVRHGLPVAAILVLDARLDGSAERLDDDALLAAVRSAAEAAAHALGIPPRTAPPLPPPRDDERPPAASAAAR